MPVVVEGDVSVEGDEFEGPVEGGQRHYLRSVKGEADIIEGRGDEAAGRDGTACVLVHKGLFEEEGSEESTNGGYEEAEFRAFGGATAFMVN